MQYLRNFNNIVMSTRLRAMYHDYQVQEVGRPFSYITLVFLEQIPELVSMPWTLHGGFPWREYDLHVIPLPHVLREYPVLVS